MIFREPSLDSASHQSGCVPLSFLIQQDAQAWNPPFFQDPGLVVGAMPAGMVGAGSGTPVPRCFRSSLFTGWAARVRAVSRAHLLSLMMKNLSLSGLLKIVAF